MKYALIRQDGVTEIREDSYPLQEGVFVLTNEQYDQLIGGQYILQNNQIVANLNPSKDL
jgi:hypothetical protein